MSIMTITTDELRRMRYSEGLILQGCGGDLNEWVDRINEILTNEGILNSGSKFQNCLSFVHDGTTCLLFPLNDEVKIHIGNLGRWWQATHEQFDSTWLSDYVRDRLGGFIEEREQIKPDCPLISQDGNIFNLMGIASRTLRQNGLAKQATEMCRRITSSGSYYEALGIIGEYVNITSVDDRDKDCEEGMEMNL